MTYGGVRMSEWAVPVTTQTLIKTLVALPTFLKMFSGLLSDRVPIASWGRRKPYIFLGLVFYVPAFAVMAFHDAYDAVWIASLMAVMAGWMIVDGTMDGFAVDITPDEFQGSFQGVHSATRMVGFAAGSVLIPLIGPKFGWTPTVALMAVAAIVQTVSAFFFREPRVTRQDLKNLMPLRAVLKEAFGSSKPWMGILFMLSLTAVTAIPGVAQLYILTNLGWGRDPGLLKLYGLLNLTLFGGAAIGSFVFGRIMSRRIHSMLFYVLTTVVYWILMLPWLLVARSGGTIPPHLRLPVPVRHRLRPGERDRLHDRHAPLPRLHRRIHVLHLHVFLECRGVRPGSECHNRSLGRDGRHRARLLLARSFFAARAPFRECDQSVH